jgi:hypothetical protein
MNTPPVLGSYQKWKLITGSSQRPITGGYFPDLSTLQTHRIINLFNSHNLMTLEKGMYGGCGCFTSRSI